MDIIEKAIRPRYMPISGRKVLLAATCLMADLAFAACAPVCEALAHPGGYRLVVRGGRPSFEGDAEGRRHARAAWLELRRAAGTNAVGDCVRSDWPKSLRRGMSFDGGTNSPEIVSLYAALDAVAAARMNVFGWTLPPGFDMADAGDREDFKRVVYHGFKRGVTVVPKPRAAFLSDRRVLRERLKALCDAIPRKAMPYVDVGTNVAARSVLKELGKEPFDGPPLAPYDPARVRTLGESLWKGAAE